MKRNPNQDKNEEILPTQKISMSRKLRVFFSGMGGNALNTDFLRPILEELQMELVIISEWANADIQWNLKTWIRDLSKADIVVAPQRVALQSCKSNTKVTQAQSLGLPVVASPLRAYQEAIQHGETGFICDKPEEWRQTLTLLRDDEELRKRIGSTAKEAVKERYSINAVGLQWLQLLKNLCVENGAPPKVDIIIPTYNNLEYLKTCVESVRSNTDWPYNLIVVDSGSDGTREWLRQQPDVIRVESPNRLHFAAALNVGLRVAGEKYVCFLNDDTIVGEGWLPALMREAMKPGILGVGPFSNCDQGWLHHEEIIVHDKKLRPGMSLEEIRDILPHLSKVSRPKTVHRRDWLAFYCTVIPRYLIDHVGLLDEGFKSGDEDLDYSRRLRKAYPHDRFVQTYDAWVFHFGGRTRKTSSDQDPERHRLDDAENHRFFVSKWGDFGIGEKAKEAPAVIVAGDARPSFVVHTGPAWEPWSPKSIDEGGIGGSETCAFYVAREFARKGFHSIVFGDCQGLEGLYDGVEFRHHAGFREFAQTERMDLFVASRRTEPLDLPMRARRRAVWVHDIFIDPNPAANLRIDRVDKFLVLSPWHRKFFLSHHRQVPLEKVHVTRNGIDLSRFEEPLTKIRGRIVYSSSPDRGLSTLLDLLPEIRKEVPEAEVHVFYGFDNWEKMARARGNEKDLARIEAFKRRLSEPGVVYRGRIGQKALAREFLMSDAWIYPTWFTETFCISALEAMASGTPVVCSNVAALETTVGQAGAVIHVGKNPSGCGKTDDPRFLKGFLKESIRTLTDRSLWEEYSDRGIERAKAFTWTGIADEWLRALGLPDLASIPAEKSS